MNKRMMLTVACALAYAGLSHAAEAAAPAAAPKSAAPMDCTQLSAAEQQFASGLSADSKAMYCGMFNADQRMAAMQQVGQPDASGNVMTADQAVQKVAQDNNMMMPGMPMMTPAKPAPGGGCQVK
jgi:hypothetical protein